VRPAQVSAQEVWWMFRRRKKYLFLPAIIVIGLCVAGAFLLPKKYESSTTIMVQKDEVLNPLVSYSMAVATADDDRLQTFNEIVYSNTAIQMLIDSLHLDENMKTDEQRQDLIKDIKKQITTDRPGTETFKISYLDTKPIRAQRAVSLLAAYFINTVLQVENERNELAVQFFQQKLEQLRQKFDASQETLVDQLRSHISDMSTEARVASTKVEDADNQIMNLDNLNQEYKRNLVVLQQLPDKLGTEEGEQMLFDLQRKDLPYAADLRPLVSKYDDLLRRYKPMYPEVQKMEQHILDLLTIMKTTIESELVKQQQERSNLESERTQLVDDMRNNSVTQEADKEQESNVDVYRGLYDDMKIKLEQAETTRDLGKRGNERFVMIDAPMVPTDPSKPNKTLIITGGVILGVFLGLISAVTAELLDSRIRAARDVAIYKKHIIAYIPERAA
jgi:protein tyrosine kinase modulator